MPSQDHNQLLEGHEERLQRVETNFNSVSVSVARIESKQDTLQNTVADGFKQLEEAAKDVHGVLKSYHERLEPLESRHKAVIRREKERREFLKKVAIGALLAGAGILGTKGFEYFLRLIGF